MEWKSSLFVCKQTRVFHSNFWRFCKNDWHASRVIDCDPSRVMWLEWRLHPIVSQRDSNRVTKNLDASELIDASHAIIGMQYWACKTRRMCTILCCKVWFGGQRSVCKIYSI